MRIPAMTWYWAMWFLLGSMFNANYAVAEENSISLDDAVRRTLETNPNLLALGYQSRAQEGEILQAGLRPNPEIGLMVENVLGSGELGELNSAETTLSLGWVLERGKRTARVSKAHAEASLLEANASVERREVATQTARLYLSSLAFQAKRQRALEAVRIAKDTVGQIEERVRAGRAPDADLARAQAALARAELTLEDYEHELLTSNHRLAAQWGSRTPSFESVDGNILNLPRSPTFNELLTGVQDNPAVKRYVTIDRLRDAELRLAQAEARPNWRVNVGIRHLEQFGDQALVAGITIPLATRNRNQGRIAAARASSERVQVDQTATELEIETRLFALHQALLHSFHTLETINNRILPLTERALLDTERAYQAGRYEYFQLEQVRNELLQARFSQVSAAANAHEHAIEIERLSGITLAKGVRQ